MKSTRKKIVAVVIILALMLVGCSKEVVMKEFVSDNQTISIWMNEEWQEWSVEDRAIGNEGWIAASSQNGAEAIIVMQIAKNLYGVNITDMDSWKELINSSYTMSEMKSIDNPSVPGMDVSETCRCTITITADDIKGEGLILYGETEYAYYSILYVAMKMNAAKTEYFNKVCASFTETAPEIEDLSAIENTETIQWFNNTCAVLTALNGGDYTIFGGVPTNDTNKSMIENLLSEWWDVTDHESAE